MALEIKQQFFYNHPVADVWDFLTDPELISQWLMPNDFKPIPGHKFQLKTKAMPQLASDGIFHCQVIELEPLKKLSYSWKTGPGDGSISLDTLVTWTLLEKDNGTEVQLLHSGFDDRTNLDIYTGLNNGWKEKFEIIRTKLNALKDAASHT